MLLIMSMTIACLVAIGAGTNSFIQKDPMQYSLIAVLIGFLLGFFWFVILPVASLVLVSFLLAKLVNTLEGK